MYNLLNSPNGPLGQAGMSNASTKPQGLFSNAPAGFNNFGKGLDSFNMSLPDKAQGIMNNVQSKLAERGINLPGMFGGGMFGGGLFKNLFGNLFGGNGSMNGGLGSLFGSGTNGSPSLFGQPGQPGNQGSPTQSNPIALASAQGTNPVSNTMQPQGFNPLSSGMNGGGILSKFMQMGQ